MKDHNRNTPMVNDAQAWVNLNTRDFMFRENNTMKNDSLQVLVYVKGGLVQDVFVNNRKINVTVVDMDNIEAGTVDKLDLGDFPVEYADNARLQEEVDRYNEEVQENVLNNLDFGKD